jgi:hypothetical protein
MDESLNEKPGYDIIQTKWFDAGRVGIVAVNRNTPGHHWSAYIGARQYGESKQETEQRIVREGTKLEEEEARSFFLYLEDRPYWH